jgi:hypothetical protein
MVNKLYKCVCVYKYRQNQRYENVYEIVMEI